MKIIVGHDVPERYHAGLAGWIVKGIVPGGFLQAVLRNDLRDAVLRADDVDGPGAPQIAPIVEFLLGYAPAACWGSPERVAYWIERGGLQGGQERAEAADAPQMREAI